MENQYSINIQVRDSEGKPYIDMVGVHEVKRFGLRLEATIQDKTHANIVLGDAWNSLKTWMPHNQIEVSASCYDSISDTWSTVWSVNKDGKFNAH